MTKDQAVSKVLAVARTEIGYREKVSGLGLDDPAANAGGGNYTKYARDLDAIPGFYNGPKQSFPWCDCFYDWLLVQAFGPELAQRMLCQPKDSAGAGCYYSALYYRQAGRFYDSRPEPGDQIFFTYQAGEVSHTGIVETVSGGTVTTIEGNTSDMVARRSYAVGSSAIYGYGRPVWSLAKDLDAETETEGGSDPAEAGQDMTAVGVYTVTLPEIREGSEGVFVERVQTLLIARGYYCGGRIYSCREHPDGEFGPATKVAVQDLQTANGLEPDGIIRAATMTALLTK